MTEHIELPDNAASLIAAFLTSARGVTKLNPWEEVAGRLVEHMRESWRPVPAEAGDSTADETGVVEAVATHLAAMATQQRSAASVLLRAGKKVKGRMISGFASDLECEAVNLRSGHAVLAARPASSVRDTAEVPASREWRPEPGDKVTTQFGEALTVIPREDRMKNADALALTENSAEQRYYFSISDLRPVSAANETPGSPT